MYIMSKGHIIAAGFVPRDARFREFDWGVVCSFSIKADEIKTGGEETPQVRWIEVSTKGELARRARSIRKGAMVLVAGKMETRTYEGKDGNLKTVTELKCEFLSTLDSAACGEPAGAPPDKPDVECDWF